DRLSWPPVAIGAGQLRLAVDGPVGPWLAAHQGAPITVQVAVQPGDQPTQGVASARATLRYAEALPPRLDDVELPTIVAPGAHLRVLGDGLLSGNEGRSSLWLEGSFDADDPDAAGEGRPITALLPLVQRFDRNSGEVYLRPGALGLAPGLFQGDGILLTQDAAGVERRSQRLPLVIRQGPPRITGLTPDPASRGQIIRLRGAGFLPNDGNAETATVVRAVGVFTPTGKAPEDVRFTFVAERWIDHTDVRLAVRTVLGPEGLPVGFGARPGRFEGEVHVELFAGQQRATSAPVPVTFDIGPAAQFVYLRYLPGFSDGVARFGLSGAEARLRAKILAVCARDYAGLRVHFGELPPADWAEFVTVELGGPDPNGRDLFGLDNSPGKDSGNVFLNELLGGLNAETLAGGSLAYGGVFIESFFTLSPDHPKAVYIADPRFDEVFGHFAPELGGQPYVAGGPLSTARAAALERAVDALANLVGSTVTHEVGHALGLADVAGEWHNPSDTDGGLMDGGLDRPFAERAALDGHPPARFLGANRAYLERLFGL
ncbi:MAG: hypothetical protein KC613_19585, partial [Myxococcales bacterium]|nr:hypothetical protein [Myxococcales bacterium]